MEKYYFSKEILNTQEFWDYTTMERNQLQKSWLNQYSGRSFEFVCQYSCQMILESDELAPKIDVSSCPKKLLCCESEFTMKTYGVNRWFSHCSLQQRGREGGESPIPSWKSERNTAVRADMWDRPSCCLDALQNTELWKCASGKQRDSKHKSSQREWERKERRDTRITFKIVETRVALQNNRIPTGREGEDDENPDGRTVWNTQAGKLKEEGKDKRAGAEYTVILRHFVASMIWFVLSITILSEAGFTEIRLHFVTACKLNLSSICHHINGGMWVRNTFSALSSCVLCLFVFLWGIFPFPQNSLERIAQSQAPTSHLQWPTVDSGRIEAWGQWNKQWIWWKMSKREKCIKTFSELQQYHLKYSILVLFWYLLPPKKTDIAWI